MSEYIDESIERLNALRAAMDEDNRQRIMFLAAVTEIQSSNKDMVLAQRQTQQVLGDLVDEVRSLLKTFAAEITAEIVDARQDVQVLEQRNEDRFKLIDGLLEALQIAVTPKGGEVSINLSPTSAVAIEGDYPASQKRQLSILYDKLGKLEEQRASYGLNVPIELVNQIEQTEVEITAIETELAIQTGDMPG
ncbi:MAG: hypothetical protein AAF485_22575 [Chloroflexota bacterium]